MGPTGTGKTLTTSDKLLKGMSSTYLSHFLAFSAQTSANQTQDIIDSKLDKRYVCCIVVYNYCEEHNYFIPNLISCTVHTYVHVYTYAPLSK